MFIKTINPIGTEIFVKSDCISAVKIEVYAADHSYYDVCVHTNNCWLNCRTFENMDEAKEYRDNLIVMLDHPAEFERAMI